MSWESELFLETREEGRVLPPEAGIPDGLETFLNSEGVLVQPILRRRNYLTQDRCHINLARSCRPGNLRGRYESLTRAKDDPERCPFGPGKESGTPRWPATGKDYVRIGSDPWQLRSFPNLYPWLLDHLNIVETPEHKAGLDNLDAREETRALNVAFQYCTEEEALGRFVVLFRNQGVSASLSHFHWQIGSLSEIPVRVAEELQRAEIFYQTHGMNIFDAITQAEKIRQERWIGENDFVSMFAPFAPRTNNEVWLVAKRDCSSLSQTTEDERQVLANSLCLCVKNLFEISGNDDMFVIVHQLPASYSAYRLHVELFPVKPWSGAERGFGELVVEQSPEDTATLMRERLSGVL